MYIDAIFVSTTTTETQFMYKTTWQYKFNVKLHISCVLTKTCHLVRITLFDIMCAIP
jgi:hypothetical protein